MVKHYDDLISSKVVTKNGYSFANPKFGKSNTDQSFYEPMASMVVNSFKSGSVSSSLHNDAEKTISEIRANSDFLPQNLTQEEIQAMIVSQSERVEQSIKDVHNQVELIKDEINLKESLKESVVQKSTILEE